MQGNKGYIAQAILKNRGRWQAKGATVFMERSADRNTQPETEISQGHEASSCGSQKPEIKMSNPKHDSLSLKGGTNIWACLKPHRQNLDPTFHSPQTLLACQQLLNSFSNLVILTNWLWTFRSHLTTSKNGRGNLFLYHSF